MQRLFILVFMVLLVNVTSATFADPAPDEADSPATETATEPVPTWEGIPLPPERLALVRALPVEYDRFEQTATMLLKSPADLVSIQVWVKRWGNGIPTPFIAWAWKVAAEDYLFIDRLTYLTDRWDGTELRLEAEWSSDEFVRDVTGSGIAIESCSIVILQWGSESLSPPSGAWTVTQAWDIATNPPGTIRFTGSEGSKDLVVPQVMLDNLRLALEYSAAISLGLIPEPQEPTDD